MNKLILGSDKSGFQLKEAVKLHLLDAGYEVDDQGTLKEQEPLPFYTVAERVAKRVSDRSYDRGILICGTGMGMSIVANKYPGVAAAVCESTYAAEKARAINDANILTMGGWITGEILGCEIADVFLSTEFTQGLEEWRAENLRRAQLGIRELEQSLYREDV